MSLNILLVNWRDIAHPEAGGAEVHAHEIFRRIAAEGHRVFFLASAWPGCAAREQIDGIRIIRAGRNMTFNYYVPAALRTIAARESIDIVVEDVNKIPFRTPSVTDLPRLILFHHLFGTTIFREAVFPVAAYVYLWERLIPWLYRGERIQAVSVDTADELARMGLDRERIRVVYNGIDTELYTPAPEDDRSKGPVEGRYLLYMGRIKRYKRLDLILEAFGLAAARGLEADVRLVFAGGGDDYPRLRSRASSLGLTPRVDFLGRVSEQDKIGLLRHALCVVNPSPKEGWGITNMEASACGTPVVASRSPGLRESVKNGETGFHFNPGDTEDFAENILRVTGDSALREKLGRGARKFAESLSWDESARLTLEHIEDILEESR